jgi:mono/diheme cytochrome c family protein
MRAYLLGIATVLVVLIAGAFVMVWFGLVPARADVPPMPGEKWMANHSLDATMAREEPQPPYPYGPVTDAMLVAGVKAYVANCAVCHGSAGSPQSIISKGMYIKPPQFTRHTPSDDPEGEDYWKIEHGIRFTAMPSFKGNLDEPTIWNIVYFIKHGTKDLPPAADAIWHQPHGD